MDTLPKEKEPNRYPSASATLIFLPGEHILEGEMWVLNDSNVSFIGTSSSSPLVSSKIVSGNASFVFANISKVEISRITFFSCGIDLHTNTTNKDKCLVPTIYHWPDAVCCFVPALSAFSVKQFILTDCLAESCYGGVFVEYSSILLSSQCRPRLFYSQPRQLSCARHPALKPTHLPLSYLFC